MAIATASERGLLGRMTNTVTSFRRRFESQSPSPSTTASPPPDPLETWSLPEAEEARGLANEASVIFDRALNEAIDANAKQILRTAKNVTFDRARKAVEIDGPKMWEHRINIQRPANQTLQRLGLASEWNTPPGTTSLPRGPRRLS